MDYFRLLLIRFFTRGPAGSRFLSEQALRDYAVDQDPLTRPINRYAYDENPSPPPAYPTRGIPDHFHFVGHLRRNNDIFRLYGRRRYRDVYDYFVSFHTPAQQWSKVAIAGNRELSTGDRVAVPLLGEGAFEVFLNPRDDYLYDPLNW